jgi:hypothetical protein
MSDKPPLTVVQSLADPYPPPASLEETGRTLWTQIMSEYRIEDTGGRQMLFQACRAADRAESLGAQVDDDGFTTRTKTGMRAHLSSGKSSPPGLSSAGRFLASAWT